MVDVIAGYELLSFMDAYLGYNKIKMHPTDEDMILYIIGRAIYYYKVMPFSLKNAGATFQCMVNEVFKELIRNKMEVYVDDMLVKSLDRSSHEKDLGEVFALPRKFNVKFNPENCTFGVAFSEFHGYLITQWGIKANPDQISGILEMRSLTTIKEVQILNGRLTAPQLLPYQIK